jgi:hypothetical protein
MMDNFKYGIILAMEKQATVPGLNIPGTYRGLMGKLVGSQMDDIVMSGAKSLQKSIEDKAKKKFMKNPEAAIKWLESIERQADLMYKIFGL